MAFLTIAGVTYETLRDSPGEGAPESRSIRKRAWAGNMRVQTGNRYRAWSFNLLPLTAAQYDTLIANTGASQFVSCTGDFNNNVAVQCVVDIVSGGYFKAADGVMRRPVSVTLTETG
jgi:hypothetical protein